MTGGLYGLAAEFTTAEDLVRAAGEARAAGFRRLEAYAPFPVDALEEVIPHRNPLPLIVLAAGSTGTLTGYLLQTYIAVYDYPTNIGGRPLHSWPSFVVIMFELTVLFAAAAAFLGMIFLGRMPSPYHSVANAPGFDEVSNDRFFLCIEARDPIFDLPRTREFLAQLNPERVEEVAR
jgi:hypothetical protein